MDTNNKLFEAFQQKFVNKYTPEIIKRLLKALFDLAEVVYEIAEVEKEFDQLEKSDPESRALRLNRRTMRALEIRDNSMRQKVKEATSGIPEEALQQLFDLFSFHYVDLIEHTSQIEELEKKINELKDDPQNLLRPHVERCLRVELLLKDGILSNLDRDFRKILIGS